MAPPKSKPPPVDAAAPPNENGAVGAAVVAVVVVPKPKPPVVFAAPNRPVPVLPPKRPPPPAPVVAAPKPVPPAAPNVDLAPNSPVPVAAVLAAGAALVCPKVNPDAAAVPAGLAPNRPEPPVVGAVAPNKGFAALPNTEVCVVVVVPPNNGFCAVEPNRPEKKRIYRLRQKTFPFSITPLFLNHTTLHVRNSVFEADFSVHGVDFFLIEKKTRAILTC